MRGSFRFAVGAAVLALPAAARAGGLFIPGVGPIAQGRAGAYVATAEDPSAIAINPAGLAKTEGVEVLVGANFFDYSLTFTRRGTYDATDNADLPWEGQAYDPISNEAQPGIGFGSWQAVPMIAVAIDLEKQVRGLHVAVGLHAPSSYPVRSFGEDWTINEDDATIPPPPTRYDTVAQEAAVVLPSIAAGYRINDQIDVGGRFSWGFADLKATQFVWGEQNFDEWTGAESVFDVDVSDKFVPQFGVGALYRVNDSIEVGLNWESQINVHAKGTGNSIQSDELELTPGQPVVIEPAEGNQVQCESGGRVGALKTCIDIGLPMVTAVGGRYILRDGAGEPVGDVELDVAWERWSAVSDYHVVVDGVVLGSLHLNPSTIRHNLRDVFSFRLGGGYSFGPVGVRAGVAHDTAAAKENWERVDFDGAARTTLALGVSVPVGDKVAIHAGGGFVYEGTRDVGTDCNPEPGNLGCEGGDNEEEPLEDRTGPDPIQPLNAGVPFQSPFNAGRYESSYLIGHIAVTAAF